MIRKIVLLCVIGLGIWTAPYSKVNAQSSNSGNSLIEKIEQANRELEQDPRIIEAKRLMDGELFIGCNVAGAQDSLKFFQKKLSNLKKFNSTPSSKVSYNASRPLYYYYAKKTARYAQHLKLSDSELINIYAEIEQLFIDFPQDTIASLCFNLEKARLTTNQHLDLGDYFSYRLTTFINNSDSPKRTLLELFWPAAYFFGRFNSAPFLLQKLAEVTLSEEDYKTTFYYAERAERWYRSYLRDYGGMSNQIQCEKIKKEAKKLEESANGGHAGYAYLSTKADMSESAKVSRRKSIPFFTIGEPPDIVAAYFYRELALDYIAENNIDLGTYYLQLSIDAFNSNVEFINSQDKSFRAHNYLVLSNAYNRMGDTDNAINALSSGIAFYPGKDSDKPELEMSKFSMLLNLANIYLDNDQRLKAYKTMQTVDKLWNQDCQLYFDFIPLIGITYSSRNQIVNAMASQYAYARARCNVSKGEFENAEILLKGIIEGLDTYDLSKSSLKPMYLSCLIDVLIAEKHNEDAQHHIDILLSLPTTNVPVNLLVHTNILAARLHMKDGEYVQALSKCEAALSLLKNYISSTLMLLSESEREKFYGMIEPEFNELISICTSMKSETYEDGADLLAEISMVSKGILLSSSNYLKYIVYQSGDRDLKKLYNRIKNLREADAVMSSESSSDNNSSKELTKLEFELLNHPLIRNSLMGWDSLIVPSIQQIQCNLKDDEVAVDFIKFDTEIESHSILERDQLYYAIIIDNKNRPVFIPISQGKNLSLELDNLSSEVCDIVWEPLRNHISNYRIIYFSPVGVLNNLPLENLTNVINQNISIRRISSLRELAVEREMSPKSKAILFGGINYNTGASEYNSEISGWTGKKRAFSFDDSSRAGISPLQHSLGEVNGIKQSLDQSGKKGLSAEVKSSDKASEQYLRSLDNSDLNILHFATHGFYYEDLAHQATPRNLTITSSPRLSSEALAMNRTGLFLAGANANFKNAYLNPNDDGILTAREVSELYFPKLDLVVLSACKTGLGDINEDGVYGLQRGFKKAGAKTVLMSLWEVNDMATSMLVQEFYKSWLMTGSQSKALRIAQDKVRNHVSGSENFSDPFFWAGFVLLDAEN